MSCAGQRGTLYTAAGLGATVMVLVGGSVILRISIAASVVGGFLAWRFWSLEKQQNVCGSNGDEDTNPADAKDC